MSLVTKIESILSPLTATFDSSLFLTQLGAPSKIYKAQDLLSALSIVANEPGVAGKVFYLGEEGVDRGWEYGLVNLAAFLAQCMKETILYDACDENNWDSSQNPYPLSNSCGQLGQSYQDYNCPAGEEHMQCPIDPDMQITATTHATWYGAPPPLFCGPKSVYPHTGFWNHGKACNNPWTNPPQYCDVYEGQQSGAIDDTNPVPNVSGRTDVEGCCWWGRGAIQTTGICNYGKLNYYIGARAAEEGRSSRYPEIDFCKTPDTICSDPNYPELKWIAGLFYWMESVQSYDREGWVYLEELHKFVDGGMIDTSFINSVSGIVNRGCHNPPCATGNVDGAHTRSENFKKVLQAIKEEPTVPVPVPQSQPESNSQIESGAVSTGTNAGSTSIQLSSWSPLTSELIHFQEILEDSVLSYTNLDGIKTKSQIYTFEKLMHSLTYAIDSGYHDEHKFYTHDTNVKYGMVNLAAFLAQSMTESIQYDACEEFHLDSTGTKYAISNSCGQFGNNYQDYDCDGWDGVMECPVASDMRIEAVSGGKYNNQRPHFYCRSKADEPFTGLFDTESSAVVNDVPYPNSAGRTNVEGCCFWGRGALMTKGPCMLGKLDHYLGARAADEGRTALYPGIDFCTRPDLICKTSSNSNVVWDIALFEWVERIQSHDKDGWNYVDQLHQFVDEGMTDVSFINKVSEIVTGAVGSQVPFTGQRWANFNILLDSLQLRGDENYASHARGFNNFDFWMRWTNSANTGAHDGLYLGFIVCTILLLRFGG